MRSGKTNSLLPVKTGQAGYERRIRSVLPTSVRVDTQNDFIEKNILFLYFEVKDDIHDGKD